MERKLTFFSSDWHIGHKNSIIFDKRPFTDLDHMHRVLINNFNASVPKGSVTYFLGDMGLCSGTLLTEVISQLNGTKVLILGNHDKSSEAMYKIGFDVVVNSMTLYIANSRVELNHCPPRGVFRESTKGMQGSDGTENWHGERRHSRFSREYDPTSFWLHGHTHKQKNERTLNRMFDVGVPANAYKPVSISQIESWIACYKRDHE